MSRPKRFLEVCPGTDINEIRFAHPDWTEDQCREEQMRAAKAAFADLLASPKTRRPE